MDSQRDFLIVSLAIVSLIIWQIWQIDHIQEFNNKHDNHQETTQYIKHNIALPNQEKKETITIQTDLFLLKINTYYGNIEEAYLLNYFDKLNSKKPLHLLTTSQNFIYQTKSGLININDTNQIEEHFFYTPINKKTKFFLSEQENTIHIPLKYTSKNGIEYTKTYVLQKNNFSIHIYHKINNTTTKTQTLKCFGEIIQSIHYPKSRDNNNHFSLYNYRSAAYSTTNNKYQKYSFKDMKNKDLHVTTKNGWIAMLEQYFVTAWYPLITKNNISFYTRYTKNTGSIIFESDPFNIPAHSQKEIETILWLGPKIQKTMAQIAPNLNLTVDYGWLWFISQPLFKLLQFIYSYVGNWGFSIIIITLIIRLITYPLTKAQYTSMAKIRLLQPKLTIIHNQFKNDKYKYHQEIMALYKSENVNPLGGCLPLIIQMPIFLALYYMLSGSVELRHANFALWIHDLSSQDPLYILPIIMGISMFLIQKMSPSTITDPIQKKLMTCILIIFTAFFLWFPSGLVLYYIISNIITIIQQHIIYHGLAKKGLYTLTNNKYK